VAAPFTPVPRLLDKGVDVNGSWIVTAGLRGENAVSERWRSEPATAVAAIGRGLRALHDALPVSSCPFSWTAEERVSDALRRAATGKLDNVRWHPQHRSLGTVEALELVAEIPPPAGVVVCHGDACAPNTLLGAGGQWTGHVDVGHVDLGDLGVADPWADLAIATWSCDWNYGPGWQGALLAAYGIDPDPLRLRYYRLLWDLGP
jgi:aminoglycoside phosphotransferase